MPGREGGDNLYSAQPEIAARLKQDLARIVAASRTRP